MRLRTLVAGLALGACVLSSFLPPATPAAAERTPPHTAGQPASAGPGGTDQPPAAGPEVTLVTGDVVRLDTLAGGAHQAVLVRPGGAGGGFHAYTDPAGDAYFVPDGAEAALAHGTLDQALFNVSALVRQGYDDAHSAALPLIVTYPDAKAAANGLATTLAAGSAVAGGSAVAAEPRSLPTVHGFAVKERKNAAGRLWEAWSAAHAGTLWLDAQVSADLDQSVPQIGAPAAWDRGLTGDGVKVAVLDTGIDPTHPDLADRIVASRDFSGKGSVVDGAGHGTHVASTLAGSGAASQGRYRGVAPDADLLVGKVLGDDGSGPTSAVIEGARWAAAQGADIVNMSLGGQASRGDDPLSMAIDTLTEQYGTLFVVAAGNYNPFGPVNSFVSAPGSAAAALTVGAVTKADRMYGSSRHGRIGDTAVKPEVVAPGVGITAAQAAGTGNGQPYVSMTGTSMATPHVAGSAALLLQRHPDWEPMDVKAALTSTAVPVEGATIVWQGAGRIDVDRATRQDVYVDHGTLDAGYFAQPYDPATMVVKKTLTYHNASESPVTLDLSTQLADKNGKPAAIGGALTLTPSSLTLEPGGHGTVEVVVDARDLPPSTYTGRVVAAGADGLSIGTAVGFYKQDDTVDLTVKAIDRHGRPAQATMRLAPYQQKDFDPRYYPENFYLEPGETEQVRRVPEGDYNLWADVLTFDESGRFVEEKSVVSIPQVHAYAPNFTVVLDARKARPVTLTTPKDSTVRSFALSWWRGGTGDRYHSYDSMGVMVGDGTPERVSVAGTETVDDAPFVVTAAFDAGPEVLTGRIRGGPALHPVWEGGPAIDRMLRLTAVDAGSAREDELDGVDLRGRLAFVRESADVAYDDQVERVVARGAVAVLLASSRPGVFWPGVGGPVPVLAVPQRDGDVLRSWMAGGRGVVELTGQATARYAYDVAFTERQRVPEQLAYTVRAADLATLTTRIHTTGTGERGWRLHSFVPTACGCTSGMVVDTVPKAGYVRTEYVTARPDLVVQPAWQFRYGGLQGDVMYPRTWQTYRPGERRTDNWLAGPLSPGPASSTVAAFGTQRVSKRDGDSLRYDIAAWTDSAGDWSPVLATSRTRSRLYRDGVLLTSSSALAASTQVPAAESTYRLEADFDHDGTLFGLSTHASSAWTFRSAGTGGSTVLPLVDLDYTNVVRDGSGQRLLDLANTAPDDTAVNLIVRAGHQLGSQAPAVRTVRVWVSFDDGTTWRPAGARRVTGETFAASYRHPHLRKDGFASLRVSAVDPDGNAVEQTLIRAYRVSSG